MPEDVAGGERRTLPRFEVIMVVSGGRQRFYALDHLTKESRVPLDPFSRVQAEGLVALMANRARENKEPLTVERLVASLTPPPSPKRERNVQRSNPADRHKPEARTH
jgi:hypothetical protein